MTNIYIDLEFTGLHQHTTPISLGIVSDKTDVPFPAFYAEFTDYDESQVTSWIEENVISHLGNQNINLENVQYVSGTADDICIELRAWLRSFNDQITVYADCGHYDFVLFISLFGDAFSLPPYIAPAYVDVNTLIADGNDLTIDKAFDVSRREIYDDIDIDSLNIIKPYELFISNDVSVQHMSLWDAYVSFVISENLMAEKFDNLIAGVFNEFID